MRVSPSAAAATTGPEQQAIKPPPAKQQVPEAPCVKRPLPAQQPELERDAELGYN